jgi:hypothetical protein
MISKKRMFLALLFISLLTGPVNAGTDVQHNDEGGAAMKMHHLHIMMSHGLGMVAGGSNYVMMAEMNMIGSMDDMTREEGYSMINEGKELIMRSVTGPEMMEMMKGNDSGSNAMQFTHELGEAMLMVINILEAMRMAGMDSHETMSIHHLHMMINHALEKAAEGSNLIMIGNMGMSGKVDKFSVSHGREMLGEAGLLMGKVMAGKTMKELHKKGMTPENNPLMNWTHRLAETAIKIINMLIVMPAVGK